MSDQAEPYTIELRGEMFVLTDDEAAAVRHSLLNQFIARTKIEQQAAREAGQVWFAGYWRHGAYSKEESFSLEDAAGHLDAIDENGSGYGDAIHCPDGTVYTRRDWPGDDWSSLSAAEEKR